ncbi:hypothetical protein KO481_37820 [Nocardia sp. NEAU-G5]|uniref:Uncharacterized protein n=1 Tax=Nocardia albiluteola TaxID=2842303 RepID=A0ABS6BAD9_9NOCA|nr:hypothetical protein [Nocardia albiluteola]MBU3067266.1 hypothetical protein [Nocardia albiluteola]
MAAGRGAPSKSAPYRAVTAGMLAAILHAAPTAESRSLPRLVRAGLGERACPPPPAPPRAVRTDV